MRLLLSGSRGFFGTHLRHFLERNGVEVFSFGPFESSDAQHRSVKSFRDHDRIVDILRDLKPDFLFHLAGAAPGTDDNRMREVNIEYIETILRARKKADASAMRLVAVGSAAEYGRPQAEDLPLVEAHNPLPEGLYGQSKLEQTRRVLESADEGFWSCVVRPFNLIGSGMPMHLALGSFVQQIRTAKVEDPVLRVGNLQSARDFMDVADACAALWSLVSNDKANGEVINLASGIPTPLQELVDLLLDGLRRPPRIEIEKSRLRPGELPVHYASVEKLRHLTPAISLRSLNESIAEILRSDLGPLSKI